MTAVSTSLYSLGFTSLFGVALLVNYAVERRGIFREVTGGMVGLASLYSGSGSAVLLSASCVVIAKAVKHMRSIVSLLLSENCGTSTITTILVAL